MKIYTVLENIVINNPVITIGTFDGVHLGHKSIIERLISAAKIKNGESTVITFWPHPRQVLFPGSDAPQLLTSLQERLDLLTRLNVEHLIILPFSKKFAEYSATDFIQEILVSKLKVNHLLIGDDHHFGKNREGSYPLLLQYASMYGFSVEKLDFLFFEEIKVSSTKIRKSLAEGNIETANKLLGYNYLISGVVVPGNKFGRTIGFPTANLIIPEKSKLLPKNGVYAVWVEHNDTLYKGMLNIGYRPTVADNQELSIEVHILEFEKDIYRQNIRLHFVERIRDEQKFDNKEQLKNQIQIDKQMIIKAFSSQISPIL